MSVGRRCMLAGMLVCGVALTAATPAQVASGGTYRISRATIDGGGDRSAGGSFQLRGSIGQPDAGRSAGGARVVSGGFWRRAPGDPDAPPSIFRDGFESPD